MTSTVLLTYLGADTQQHEVTIKTRGDGSVALAASPDSESAHSASSTDRSNSLESYPHLEALLVACVRDGALLGVQLRAPALRGRLPQVHSPALLRTGGKEEPWNYWQLGQDEAAALAVLQGKKSGAFVLRDNPHKAGGLLLSYVFQGRIVDEPVSHTPASSMFTQGYCLDREQNAVFSDLHKLVDAYSRGGTVLNCALRVSDRPSRSATPSAVPRRGSALGRTFADLEATARSNPEQLGSWQSPGTRRKKLSDDV